VTGGPDLTARHRSRWADDARLLRAAFDGSRRWVGATVGRRLAAAGLVLALALSGAVWVVDGVLFPPEQPVRQLFAALAARDGATAAGLAGCAPRPLCSAAALREGYQPPTDLRVGHVTRDSNTAYVAVSYRLAGRAVTGEVAVRRPGGPRLRWTIRDGGYAMSQVVSTVVARARVGGVTVATVPAPTDTGEPTLPGVYTVAGAADDPLFTATAPSASVAAAVVAPVTVTLDVTIRPALVAATQAQVDAALDACAARADDILHLGCPFDERGDRVAYHVGDDVTWIITRYPRVDLRLSDDPVGDGGPVLVRTVSPGEARATWPGGGFTVDVDPAGVVTVGPDGVPRYRS
jgi:hypothetical protein